MFHGEVLPQGFAFVSFSGEESVQAAGNSTPTQTTQFSKGILHNWDMLGPSIGGV